MPDCVSDRTQKVFMTTVRRMSVKDILRALCKSARPPLLRGPRKVVNFVGKGGARKQPKFSPKAETEVSELCDDAVVSKCALRDKKE